MLQNALVYGVPPPEPDVRYTPLREEEVSQLGDPAERLPPKRWKRFTQYRLQVLKPKLLLEYARAANPSADPHPTSSSATRRHGLFRAQLKMSCQRLPVDAQGKRLRALVMQCLSLMVSTIFGAYGTLPEGRQALETAIGFRKTAYQAISRLNAGEEIRFHGRALSYWVLQYFSFLTPDRSTAELFLCRFCGFCCLQQPL